MSSPWWQSRSQFWGITARLQYCRVPKNSGTALSPPAWTVLIFPKSSRFRSYFKRAPRSYFKRARVHVHVQSCTCTYVHVHVHVHMYMYMYICTCHVLLHVHVPLRDFLCGSVERSYFACQKKLLFSNERSKLFVVCKELKSHRKRLCSGVYLLVE